MQGRRPYFAHYGRDGRPPDSRTPESICVAGIILHELDKGAGIYALADGIAPP